MAKDQPHATPPGMQDADRIRRALVEVLNATPSVPLDAATFSKGQRKQLWNEVQAVVERLETFAAELDLVALPPVFYNPADPDTFAESIGNKLLLQEPTPLEQVRKHKFYGSGVYAIFYRGELDVYHPIRGTLTPIYVGKGNPTRPQTSKNSPSDASTFRTPRQQGYGVWTRLKEHADNISEVSNLRLSDFDCRYLVTATGEMLPKNWARH